MHRQIRILLCFLALTVSRTAIAQQQSPSVQGAPPAPTEATPKPKSAPAPAEPQNAVPDAGDTELQMVVQQAGNDRAALIRNLEDFLVRHPDSPKRAAIYRALLESEIQLKNQKRALEYAEQLIAIQPEDIEAMFLAITILEKMPDDASQVRGIDYDTRLIERTGKANPESRPPQMTLEDWQAGRNKFVMNLYGLRGRMERHLHKNDEAVKDLNQSFRLSPNAVAALNLGEIAEEEKHADEAVRQYAVAFLLSDQGQEENVVNRDSLRLKMGNLWRLTHDSNAGLGDLLLTAFDKARASAKADKPEAIVYNKGLTDPFQFSLRRVDGTAAVKLADVHGKTVILDFWNTWCSYCRTMEALLADVRKKFAGHDDVVFLRVNADEEEALVAPFLQAQKVEGTLVFADGLDNIFRIESIPTIIVLDRAGKIAYRAQGFAPDGFVDIVSGAITKASSGSAQ